MRPPGAVAQTAPRRPAHSPSISQSLLQREEALQLGADSVGLSTRWPLLPGPLEQGVSESPRLGSELRTGRSREPHGRSQPLAGASHPIRSLVNVSGRTRSSALTRRVSSPQNRSYSPFSSLASIYVCIFTYLQNVSFLSFGCKK